MSFLNMGKIATYAKAAKKSGRLKVGIIDGYTVMITDHALFAVETDHTPDKMKGIIAELAGFLPSRTDTLIEIQKETVRELEPAEYKQWHDMIYASGVSFCETPVIVTDRQTKVRLIQDIDDNEIVGIKEELLCCIDKTKIEYDIEGDPQGPEVLKNFFVKYKNATTVILLVTYQFTEDCRNFVDTIGLERLDF